MDGTCGRLHLNGWKHSPYLCYRFHRVRGLGQRELHQTHESQSVSFTKGGQGGGGEQKTLGGVSTKMDA